MYFYKNFSAYKLAARSSQLAAIFSKLTKEKPMKLAKQHILTIAAALFLVLAGSAGTAWYAQAAESVTPPISYESAIKSDCCD